MLRRYALSAALLCCVVQLSVGVRPVSAQAQPYIGDIMVAGFNFCPRGWTHAEGQLLPTSQYEALFALLDTRFGGDGRTTFGFPDYRGRAAIGTGSGSGFPAVESGDTGGHSHTQLRVAQLPPHAHDFAAAPAAIGDQDELPPDAVFAPDGDGPAYSSQPPDVSLSPLALETTAFGNAYPNAAPSLGLIYCIALEGLFPSRD